MENIFLRSNLFSMLCKFKQALVLISEIDKNVCLSVRCVCVPSVCYEYNNFIFPTELHRSDFYFGGKISALISPKCMRLP
jgi:hypothetical protein